MLKEEDRVCSTIISELSMTLITLSNYQQGSAFSTFNLRLYISLKKNATFSITDEN